MTKDEAKQWLNRGWELNEAINKRLETQYKAYILACGTTSCGSDERVQTSCKNSTEDNLARYIDITNEINQMTDKLYAVKREILSVIGKVPKRFHRKLLLWRYFKFKDWEYIAHKTGKSIDCIKKYHMENAIKDITQDIV